MPGSVDSMNNFEDLSGSVETGAYTNPYDALIEACENDPKQIQERYATHRTTRNGQQRAKFLGPDFPGLILDTILQKREDPTIEPGYIDPRNSLVFWIRPPLNIRLLISEIQRRLLTLAPNVWLMPTPQIHLTALEVTHSLSPSEIATILSTFPQSTIEAMTSITSTHRARLLKPLVSYDTAAIALSFLPAAGEPVPSSLQDVVTVKDQEDEVFTYHHLRQSLYSLASGSGVKVESRYVVPSVHTTIGRFLTDVDHDTAEKRRRYILGIEDINRWLAEEVWFDQKGEGEWVCGQEVGIGFYKGTLWYGDGEPVMVGKGF